MYMWKVHQELIRMSRIQRSWETASTWQGVEITSSCQLRAGAGAKSCPSKGVHFDGQHIDQLVLHIRTVTTHIWVAPGDNLWKQKQGGMPQNHACTFQSRKTRTQ